MILKKITLRTTFIVIKYALYVVKVGAYQLCRGENDYFSQPSNYTKAVPPMSSH